MTAPTAETESPLLPVPGPLFATFPRRLNALTADLVILMLFSGLMFVLESAVDSWPMVRLVLAALWYGTLLLYEPAMVTWCGGTLGHRLMNLRVVDDRTQANPGFFKAVGRQWAKVLLGLLSFLTMSFSRRHQALHDMMTRSTVRIRDPSQAKPYHYVREGEPLIRRERED
jgi:uncharacterized RDD family membrane protein YckC